MVQAALAVTEERTCSDGGLFDVHSPGSRMHFNGIIPLIKSCAENSDYIEAVILVGLYARETNRRSSDIDLCILTGQKDQFIENPSFTSIFGNPECVTTEHYGPLLR